MNLAPRPKTGAGHDRKRGITAAHLLSVTALVLLGLLGCAPSGEREASERPNVLRTLTHTYVEHEGGDRELYDMREDPHQVDNIHDRADEELLKTLEGRLEELEDCAGEQCREAEG